MSDRGLSGHLLPVRVKPQADELLSSWLTRLSLGHGLHPRAFCTSLWPAKRIWVGDIDRHATTDILSVLAKKTAISLRRAFATTLNAYEGKLWESLTPYGSMPWLLLGALQSQRRCRPGLQYWPQCLRADAIPYFRRCWRLGFVTVCTDHHRRLLDRCPACREPVNFQCLPGDTDTITRCYQCQLDLGVADAPVLEASPVHQRLVAFQTFLLGALTTGWCQLGNHEVVRLPHYLRVLHHLGRLLVTHRHADHQRAMLCRRVAQPYFAPCLPAAKRWALEGLSITDRFRLLLLLAWWVDDWPERFMAVCLATLLWPSELLRRMLDPPLWYEQIVQKVSWWEALKKAIQEYDDKSCLAQARAAQTTPGTPERWLVGDAR